MEKFCPIIYSVSDGAAISETVEADDPDQACRRAASKLLGITAKEAEARFAARRLEVIAVIKGNPEFVKFTRSPSFPWA